MKKILRVLLIGTFLLGLVACGGGSGSGDDSADNSSEKRIDLSIGSIEGELVENAPTYVALVSFDSESGEFFKNYYDGSDLMNWIYMTLEQKEEYTKAELEEIKAMAEASASYETYVPACVAKVEIDLENLSDNYSLVGELNQGDYYRIVVFSDVDEDGTLSQGDFAYDVDCDGFETMILGGNLDEVYSGVINLEHGVQIGTWNIYDSEIISEIDTLIEAIDSSGGDNDETEYTGGATPYFNRDFEKTLYSALELDDDLEIHESDVMSYSALMTGVAMVNPGFDYYMLNHKLLTETTWGDLMGVGFENREAEKLTIYTNGVYETSDRLTFYTDDNKEHKTSERLGEGEYDPVNDRYKFMKTNYNYNKDVPLDNKWLYEFIPYGDGYLLRGVVRDYNTYDYVNENIISVACKSQEYLLYITDTKLEVVYSKVLEDIGGELKLYNNSAITWEGLKSTVSASMTATVTKNSYIFQDNE